MQAERVRALQALQALMAKFVSEDACSLPVVLGGTLYEFWTKGDNFTFVEFLVNAVDVEGLLLAKWLQNRWPAGQVSIRCHDVLDFP